VAAAAPGAAAPGPAESDDEAAAMTSTTTPLHSLLPLLMLPPPIAAAAGAAPPVTVVLPAWNPQQRNNHLWAFLDTLSTAQLNAMNFNNVNEETLLIALNNLAQFLANNAFHTTPLLTTTPTNLKSFSKTAQVRWTITAGADGVRTYTWKVLPTAQ
jgi:hypothetical protein